MNRYELRVAKRASALLLDSSSDEGTEILADLGALETYVPPLESPPSRYNDPR